MNKIAIYPGTFDPVTLGHMDIIQRGAGLFDRLIVAVAVNIEKSTLFDAQERIGFLEEGIQGLANVEVQRMDGLLVDFASSVGATALLRGLRAVSDFEYEFQMAGMNRKLNAQVETIFLMAGESTTFLSSRLIKEVAAVGGDITPFVPAVVVPALQAKLRSRMPKK